MAANNKNGDALRFCVKLLADATTNDKVMFVAHCLIKYQNQNWHWSFIPEHFANKVSKFSVSDFNILYFDICRNLWNFPCKRNKFLSKGQNIQIFDSVSWISQNIHPWPKNDPNWLSNKTIYPSWGSMLLFKNEDDVKKSFTYSSEHLTDLNSICKSAQSDFFQRKCTLIPSWKPGIMLNLFKAYCIDLNKYTGLIMDTFDQKIISIFERCDQVSTSNEAKNRAFILGYPILLCKYNI